MPSPLDLSPCSRHEVSLLKSPSCISWQYCHTHCKESLLSPSPTHTFQMSICPPSLCRSLHTTLVPKILVSQEVNVQCGSSPQLLQNPSHQSSPNSTKYKKKTNQSIRKEALVCI